MLTINYMSITIDCLLVKLKNVRTDKNNKIN